MYIQIYPWQFIKADCWVRFPGASYLNLNYYFPTMRAFSRGGLHLDRDVHAVLTAIGEGISSRFWPFHASHLT